MSQPFLSKSKFLAGRQCQKLLWFHYNAREEIPSYDDQTQAIFDQGHEVGELAKKLYRDGMDVDWDAPFRKVIEQSKRLLARRKPLFEAGFLSDGAYARADILNPVAGGKWDIIEVKSATDVKDVNIHDLAFQRHCYEGGGITVRKCFLMHVNNQYVRKGVVDPRQLFTKVDVTGEVTDAMDGMGKLVKEMLSVISARKCPVKDIGPHCNDPYSCPLMEKCWSRVNGEENSIFTLCRMRDQKRWELYREGVLSNDQIPKDYPLTEAQQIQKEAERTGRPHFDKAAVSVFLSRLRYPLHFLDFETFQTAIPLVDRTRPYQQVPFQFSLHVQNAPGSVSKHHSWLWDGEGQPHALMLEGLRGLIGANGSVVAYNAGFERSRLNEAADMFPKHAKWVKDVISRTVDLLEPFRSFAVYHPSQHGSASVKAVLPALTGKGYDDLAIGDGGQASQEFLRVTFGEASTKERKEVRRQLEEYCGLDTSGMIDIVDALGRLTTANMGG